MQLCQKERIMGRASRPVGPRSSNERLNRKVGPITRITRNPAQVISHNKTLCHGLNGRSGAAVSLLAVGVGAAFTPAIVPFGGGRGLAAPRTRSPVAGKRGVGVVAEGR